MPYAVVIWRRGSYVVDIAGLKPDDLSYLEKIPCLSTRLEVDSEGLSDFIYLFIRDKVNQYNKSIMTF